ncbi:POK9 protein, partial [Pomatostomus ruficeps]|nr:POK9 protein [Pomatostomus ruficeps]
GSLGLDLATAVAVTLIDSHPQKISTGVQGPVIINGVPQGALWLGRSSSGLKGLFVLPGVIDADYTGEIYIVVQTQFPPIYILAGSKIAQLVPVPQLTAQMQPDSTSECRESGFGSMGGLVMFTIPLKQRPVVAVMLTLDGECAQLNALLDTGADITIVA